ncbi:hypothetical protein TNCV_1710771 [Trichonephila clavipes]|nr:hypothetical protein TNCV_1710771 [Trichonephila clavipes]
MPERIDQPIRQLAIRDPFSMARGIRSRLPRVTGGSVFPKPYATDCKKCNESRICLWWNDGLQQVWRRPGKHSKLTHFAERQTDPTPGIMVSGGIMFDHREPLVHIDGCLTAKHCVTQVVEPVVLSLLQGALNTVFQQNNNMSYVER